MSENYERILTERFLPVTRSYRLTRAAIVSWAAAAMCFSDPCLAKGGEDRPEESDLDPRSPARKELLRLIDELEAKLPRDLARKLIVISMKLSTGYCSPYATRDFEEAVDSLPTAETRGFASEWKKVREHKQWPRMPKPQQSDTTPETAPLSGSS
jgi:hypothetical protein